MKNKVEKKFFISPSWFDFLFRDYEYWQRPSYSVKEVYEIEDGVLCVDEEAMLVDEIQEMMQKEIYDMEKRIFLEIVLEKYNSWRNKYGK
jgi:hypothetical protein